MLPDWVEDRIQELGTWSLDDQKRAWQAIAVIGELVDMYPRRSRERAEVIALIAQVARRKKATQLVYAKLWRVLTEGASHHDGEIRIPENIDPSTARLIIQKGGTYDVLLKADEESWTLAQARAWAINRVHVSTNEKPPTLWRYLTKALPDHLRKATGPIDEGETIAELRQAIRSWNDQHHDPAL